MPLIRTASLAATLAVTHGLNLGQLSVRPMAADPISGALQARAGAAPFALASLVSDNGAVIFAVRRPG